MEEEEDSVGKEKDVVGDVVEAEEGEEAEEAEEAEALSDSSDGNDFEEEQGLESLAECLEVPSESLEALAEIDGGAVLLDKIDDYVNKSQGEVEYYQESLKELTENIDEMNGKSGNG